MRALSSIFVSFRCGTHQAGYGLDPRAVPGALLLASTKIKTAHSHRMHLPAGGAFFVFG